MVVIAAKPRWATARAVEKYGLRVNTYGTVDEANGTIDLVRQHTEGDADLMLMRIQNDLFDLGADLCQPGKETENKLRIADAQVDRLEQEIDAMNEHLQPLKSFVLPGGSAASSMLHLARTVVRRAERLACELADNEHVNPVAIRYLNRLSDHLFVLARYLNDQGKADILWVPGANR